MSVREGVREENLNTELAELLVERGLGALPRLRFTAEVSRISLTYGCV